ncbi:MAG: hypothetical protein HZA24_05480 [Nitrospirae bacterium]|nr:hypothetical protein [Nitrospirota bacterium]
MEVRNVCRALWGVLLMATAGCGAQDVNNFTQTVREAPSASLAGAGGATFDAALASPADTALDVPVGTPIRIDFSLPAGATLPRLLGPDGQLPAQLRCDESGLRCELLPEAPLAPGAAYRVIVDAGSRADDGSAMARSRVWDFATAQAPRATVAPLVPARGAGGWAPGVRVEPLGGAVDVALATDEFADGPWRVTRATSIFMDPLPLAPHRVHNLYADIDGAAAIHLRVAIGWAETTPAGLGAGLNDITMLSQHLGVAVGDAGTVLVTEDGGDTWGMAHAGGADLRAVFMVAPDNGWAVGAAGSVLRTADGVRWQALPGMPAVNLNDILFVGAEHGFMVGDGGTVLATADGGESWAPVAIPTSANLNAIACRDALACTVVGARGAILATTDGGANWTRHAAVTRTDLTGVALLADGNGWITGHGGLLLAGGEGYGWNVYGTTGQSTLAGMTFADAHHGWAAGTGNAVIATTDGGATFSAQPLPEALALAAIATVDPARLVAVGRDGAGNGVILRTDTGGASR